MKAWLIAVLVAAAMPAPFALGDEPATRLYVKTDPSAARVLVDGKEAGDSDLLFPLPPGRHAVHVEKSGFESIDREVDVAANEVTRLELTLAAVARPAATQADAPDVKAGHEPPVLPATSPSSAEPSKAASRYINRTRLPGAVAEAMQTVLRQHPDETKWGGSAGDRLFAIAVRKLPDAALRQQAAPAFLEIAHALAVNELLTARTLLETYADAGLTDATTLCKAVPAVSGELAVAGSVRGMENGADVEGAYAVAYVLADPAALHARLQDPAAMDLVKRSYRDVMHAQARGLMERGMWEDALLLWRHLHQLKLVSPSIYLDAATCFHNSGKDDDALKVLTEALDAFRQNGSEAFFEGAGDLALQIDRPQARELAVSAYGSASNRMRETGTVTTRPSGQ